MGTIKIMNKQIEVDGKKIPLLSGEIHYWRLNPNVWGDVLDRVKEMGLNVIASYVPWQYHEYEKGKFDFEGKTDRQRNLKSFLDIVEKKNLWLIIRPGPFIYSEWVNCGIPDYIIKYHKLHPEFMSAAEQYMSEVMSVLKPHFVTNGGKIILLQADNEIDAFISNYFEDLGLGEKPGLYHEFLEEKYKNIKELNNVWKSKYKKFSDVGAYTAKIINDKNYLIRYLDFIEFRQWYINKYAHWVVNKYRSLGTDIPIYVNTYPVVIEQNWKQLQEIADIQGIDIYPINELKDIPGKMQHHNKILEKVRYTRTYAVVPYISEFEAGTCQGYHYLSGIITGNHYRLISLLALAGGIAGWNWYMLTDRDNWYMSPINQWGRIKPEIFLPFKEIVSLYNKINPPELVKMTETSVSFSVLQHSTETINIEDPVLKSFYESDIDYEFFDTQTGKISKKILFYSGNDWLDRKSQKQLVQYVEKGGILVFFQNFPRYDESFSPLNLLCIKEPDRIVDLGGSEIELLFGVEKIILKGPFFDYNTVPSNSKKIIGRRIPFRDSTMEENYKLNNLLVGNQYCVGYLHKKGKGSIFVLGVKPTPQILLALHKYFRIPIYSRAEHTNIITSLFYSKKGKTHYLIVVNNTDLDQEIKVFLEPQLFNSSIINVTDLDTEIKNKVYIRYDYSITVFVSRKNGKIFCLGKL